jgi:hypothetical protein
MSGQGFALGQLVFFLQEAPEDKRVILPRAGHVCHQSCLHDSLTIRPCQASSPTPRHTIIRHRREVYATQHEANRAAMQVGVDRARGSFVKAIVALYTIETRTTEIVGAPDGPSPLDLFVLPPTMNTRPSIRDLVDCIRKQQQQPIARADIDMEALEAQVRERLLGPDAAKEEVSEVASRLADAFAEETAAPAPPAPTGDAAPAPSPAHAPVLWGFERKNELGRTLVHTYASESWATSASHSLNGGEVFALYRSPAPPNAQPAAFRVDYDAGVGEGRRIYFTSEKEAKTFASPLSKGALLTPLFEAPPAATVQEEDADEPYGRKVTVWSQTLDLPHPTPDDVGRLMIFAQGFSYRAERICKVSEGIASWMHPDLGPCGFEVGRCFVLPDAEPKPAPVVTAEGRWACLCVEGKAEWIEDMGALDEPSKHLGTHDEAVALVKQAGQHGRVVRVLEESELDAVVQEAKRACFKAVIAAVTNEQRVAKGSGSAVGYRNALVLVQQLIRDEIAKAGVVL